HFSQCPGPTTVDKVVQTFYLTVRNTSQLTHITGSSFDFRLVPDSIQQFQQALIITITKFCRLPQTPGQRATQINGYRTVLCAINYVAGAKCLIGSPRNKI